MPTPVCTIDETGIHAPAFADVLDYLKDGYRGIYGSDLYLENDSQDGQLLSLFALAIHDANSMAVAVYNAFSPSTAQGAGLSSVVKINGIARALPSRSSVDLLVVGQAGTTISAGIATDTAGNRWLLPGSVTIPPAGQITVTATVRDLGAVAAPAGTVTSIATPTRGWQSVTNPLAAVSGAPVEPDPALRKRQAVSTALPSRTVLEGIVGGVASLPGVTRYAAYENDTDVADANGVPSHSLALVIEGGDAQAIATVIAEKKAPGSGTFGTTARTVTDGYGIPHTIRFLRPTNVPISVALTVKALAGYTSTIEDRIKQAVADYLNGTAYDPEDPDDTDVDAGLGIGDDTLIDALYTPAKLYAKVTRGSKTFKVTALKIARDGGTPAPVDVVLAFNEAAFCAGVVVTVT